MREWHTMLRSLYGARSYLTLLSHKTHYKIEIEKCSYDTVAPDLVDSSSTFGMSSTTKCILSTSFTLECISNKKKINVCMMDIRGTKSVLNEHIFFENFV